jgi:hypothetical protein
MELRSHLHLRTKQRTAEGKRITGSDKSEKMLIAAHTVEVAHYHGAWQP